MNEYTDSAGVRYVGKDAENCRDCHFDAPFTCTALPGTPSCYGFGWQIIWIAQPKEPKQ